jgi:hypothetical protein
MQFRRFVSSYPRPSQPYHPDISGGYGFSIRAVVVSPFDPCAEVVLLLPLVAVAAPLDFLVVFVAIVARDSRALTALNLSNMHAKPGQESLFLSGSFAT